MKRPPIILYSILARFAVFVQRNATGFSKKVIGLIAFIPANLHICFLPEIEY
jgi:hypothetical protein